jgi:IS5 family transposase
VIEATVFRTIGDRPSVWESRLPAELLRVDALLDDPSALRPVRAVLPSADRPASTPAGCYLRLMFLKFRYRLGYESLCAEVSDPVS